MIIEISRGNIKILFNEKKITIAGEMFFPDNDKLGFVIFKSQILHFDYPNQDVILSESEIESIVKNIQIEFEDGGNLLIVE